MTNELVTIVPHDNLQFHFESNKQISCSVCLINKTDNYVAFKVKLTNQQKYAVRPHSGVVLPKSSLQVLVLMEAQRQAPADMQCKDKFLFQCVVSGSPTMNVTPWMFCKEAGHQVYKTELGVIHVAPPVHDGSEDDSRGSVREPKARDFSELHTVLGKTVLSCSSSPLLLSHLLCCPVYSSLLRTYTESHASPESSTTVSVSHTENYSHLFDMLPVSLSTRGISPPRYQVLINFRGAELHNSFFGFLAKAMRLEKINVFTDEVEVRGTTLNSLFTRIEESKVAVAILSERYTESRWCLDELVKMIEQMEQGKLVVVPVFYEVIPSACAYLEGTFGDRLRKLEREYRSEPERIKKWKQALSSVFHIMGLRLDSGIVEGISLISRFFFILYSIGSKVITSLDLLF